MSDPLAYFITFTCYGERLHGDERGTVERIRGERASRELAPDQFRNARERELLSSPPVTLSEAARTTAAEAIAKVCEFRGWQLFALNVRTNHVHVVVSGDAQPEKMMNAFKAWATRRLRERRIVSKNGKVWTRHGSTEYVWNEDQLQRTTAYVLENQGSDLGGVWNYQSDGAS